MFLFVYFSFAFEILKTERAAIYWFTTHLPATTGAGLGLPVGLGLPAGLGLVPRVEESLEQLNRHCHLPGSALVENWN